MNEAALIELVMLSSDRIDNSLMELVTICRMTPSLFYYRKYPDQVLVSCRQEMLS